MRREYQSVTLPDGARAIILDWTNSQGPDQNLVCTEPDGRVRWTAELPTTDPTDCFVAVRQDGNRLLANTMSCHAVWIDPATGQTLKTQFTR